MAAKTKKTPSAKLKGKQEIDNQKPPVNNSPAKQASKATATNAQKKVQNKAASPSASAGKIKKQFTGRRPPKSAAEALRQPSANEIKLAESPNEAPAKKQISQKPEAKKPPRKTSPRAKSSGKTKTSSTAESTSTNTQKKVQRNSAPAASPAGKIKKQFTGRRPPKSAAEALRQPSANEVKLAESPNEAPAKKQISQKPEAKKPPRKTSSNVRKANTNQTEKNGRQVANRRVDTSKAPSTKPLKKTEPVKIPKIIEEEIYYEIVPARKLTPQQTIDTMVRKFLKTIEKYIHNDLFVDKNASILICVSGGVDSVTLLDVLAVLSKSFCFKLYIAHFNHQLRGNNSDDDEIFVKELAKSYDIPFFSESGNVAQYAERNSVSIEQAARELRYKFFERISIRQKTNLIAIAHSMDDSAETFLINLFRGSGLTGLSGIPSRRKFIKDTYLIRPFLKHKKSEIIKYAVKRKLKWREDESNKSDDFTRNKVRNDLLPKLQKDFTPAIIEILNRTARHLNGADSFISEYVADRMQYLVMDKTSDRFSIKLPLLRTYNDFIQGEIIQAALSKFYRLPIQSFNVIDRIIDLNNSPVGAVCEVGNNIIVLRDRQSLIFSRRHESYDFDEVIDRTGKFVVGRIKLILEEVDKNDVTFTDNPNIEYFDMEFMPRKLQLRTWRKGDIFKPIGMDGSVKISDLLTNLKVPLIDKQDVLVLSDGIEIFWVCGLRMGDKYKVAKQSKNILRAEYVNCR